MPTDDLLLRELNHRSSNDLQLVISILALQARRAKGEEARQALNEAMQGVEVLARARASLQRAEQPSLGQALRQVCDALQSQAEPRSILISLETTHDTEMLPSRAVTMLALAVNELVTNAIKHAFEQGRTGRIQISIRRWDGAGLSIIVDDDGLPLPDDITGDGLGLGLVRRLVAAANGLLIPPLPASKVFEIRVSFAM